MRWLTVAVILYLAATLLSTILSASFDVSMWGEVPGEDGYAAYTIIAYVVLFGVIATHLRTRPQLWRLLGAIVAMGVLFAVYALVQQYGDYPLDLRFPPNVERASSTVGNPILAGAVLLMTIPISVTLALVTLGGSIRSIGFWCKATAWALVLTVQFMGILFTESRGPWAGTLAALVSFLGLVIIFVGWRVSVRMILLLGIAGVVTLAVLLVPSQLDSDGPPAVIEHELVVDTELIQDDLTPGSELLQDDPIPSSEVTVGSEVSSITSSVSGQLASRGLSDRIDIWKDSWRLMVHRPWFELESLDLSVLRPLIGYGPEMFRYTYLLESPPLGERLIPRESLHAHNYLLHQGVETGFLGLLASLGVLVVPMLLGGYLLVWRRRDFSTIHKLLLAGLVATLVGRFLEQLFGLARVSDLTMFWVLLAIFAALPLAMGSSLEGSQPRVGTRQQSTVNWWRLGQFLVVAFLIGVIGTLTWVKTINYPRAGVIAANAGKQSNDGNLGDALSSIDRAIALAPDVWINYNRRAAIYFNYRNNLELPKESRCRLRADGLPYQACLTTEAYLGNLEAVQQRPYNFRAHYTLARSAFALANLKGDQQLETDALRFYGETAALVPTAWPLFNQLASSYLNLGQTEAAFGPLEKSLGITSGSPHSAKALLLRGVAYINLESWPIPEGYSRLLKKEV